MASKPVGGFDLVLGRLYNDFWFNRAEPQHNAVRCIKCRGYATLHRLEKLIFAFGKMTIKHRDVVTCPECLHEEIVFHGEPPPQKSTKVNLVKLFAKLPKSVQQAILTGGLKS